jgi:hypothetical protein
MMKGEAAARRLSRLTPAALVVAALLAALAPVLHRVLDRELGWALHPDPVGGDAFPGWPTHFEDRALQPLALTAREALFVAGFPGRVGRFHDGRREIIVRWVSAPTRLLHPAADCFKGVGYAIAPLPARRSSEGHLMSCFRATRAKEALTVCELIRGAQGVHAGEHWPDVSAWYWSAVLGTSPAPWWSYVVAEVSDPPGLTP